jgi:hypothetical protein
MLIYNNGHSWVKTPLADYNKSLSKRSGRFKLSEDGTLEGDVQIEYTGNSAISRRENGFPDSVTRREEEFKAEIKQRISAAEILALSIENFEDSSKPLIYSFKIRVRTYAQNTGNQLFFQPGFFEYGANPVFSSATRTHNIYFPYPWSEQDEIEIEMPKGFRLDNADSPGAVADPSKIGLLNISISVVNANMLNYNRKFHFGGGGKILFPVSVYEPMKNLFDMFHKADTHTITLKQM